MVNFGGGGVWLGRYNAIIFFFFCRAIRNLMHVRKTPHYSQIIFRRVVRDYKNNKVLLHNIIKVF